MIYNALFLPHLLYCSHLWAKAGKSIIDPLQVLQNRAIRTILRAPPLLHIDYPFQNPLLKSPILDVRKILYKKTIIFAYDTFYSVMPNFLDIPFLPVFSLHDHNTRSAARGVLQVPRVRTHFQQNFLSYYALTCWNALPLELSLIGDRRDFLRCFHKHLFSVGLGK